MYIYTLYIYIYTYIHYTYIHYYIYVCRLYAHIYICAYLHVGHPNQELLVPHTWAHMGMLHIGLVGCLYTCWVYVYALGLERSTIATDKWPCLLFAGCEINCLHDTVRNIYCTTRIINRRLRRTRSTLMLVAAPTCRNMFVKFVWKSN